MKSHTCITLLTVAILNLVACTSRKDSFTISSPDNSLVAAVRVDEGGYAYYTIKRNEVQVMQRCRLGLIREDGDFASNLSLTGASETETVKDAYEMRHGKKHHFSYEARKKVYHFENANHQKVDIIFQLSNDGVAFRYYFPGASAEVKKVIQETTSFNFSDSARAWIQPRAKAKSGWNATNPSYEENYLQDTAVSSIDTTDTGWIFPALFRENGHWILVSETAPDRDYCASRLLKGKDKGEFVVGFPEAVESFPGGAVYPESKLPWQTPWRIITIGALATVVESTLGTDLAKAPAPADIAYVKPGRASWSWVSLKDDSIVYSVQKKFIDYAATMKWEYCLIDVNWDTKIGYEKITELATYAATKNVALILWYNSAGDWNTVPYHPRNLLLTKESRAAEFSRIVAMGIKGIKVDFFGGDGQSVMAYYQDIIEDAAKHGLMVNCHGSTLPRGLQRTYPNLVSMEAVKGFEFVTFGQDNADRQASHCAMLPFTRNVFDPMDFTPVCFSEIPNVQRRTSNAFELALAVLFHSGVQHYAEKPEGMLAAPAYVRDLMSSIPVSWEATEFVDGYPGRFVVMARKAGKVWHIAGINGESSNRQVVIKLPFINANRATFITDGENNRSFERKEIELDASRSLPVTLKANGGFVMLVEEQPK